MKMDVEAFTVAKDPKTPARNEDRYVIIPDRAYAVIDGVSDKTGLRHDGQTGGQLAGRMVEEVIRKVCEQRGPDDIEGTWLAERFEERFQKFYAEIENSRTFEVAPSVPFGAQLVLALKGRVSFRFIIIGDSGLRLNGREVFAANHPLDRLCAAIRKVVWRHLDSRHVPVAEKNAIARAYTIEGLGSVLPQWSDLIDEDVLRTLRTAVFDDTSRMQETVDGSLLKKALLGGLREQNLYANRHHPLGYPCINGLPIPQDFIVQFDRPFEDIDTIELFSDGYFGYPEGSRISDWESRLAMIEATDPEKIGDYASTKGSSEGRYTDDRTIVIVRRGSQTA